MEMDPVLQKILVPFHLLGVHQSGAYCVFINPAVYVLLVLSVNIYLATVNVDVAFDGGTNIRLLLDLFQGYSPIFTYGIIVLEAIVKAKSVRAIWVNLEDILEIFEKKLKRPLKLEFQKMLFWFSIYAFNINLCCMIIDFTIIVGVRKNTAWFYNKMVNFIGFFGCRFALLFFVLLVRIYRFLLQNIVKYQQEINFKLVHCAKRKDLMKKQEDNQRNLRRAYNLLTLINWEINESLKFSLLATFASNIVCMAIVWLWNYLSIRFGNPFMFGEWKNAMDI